MKSEFCARQKLQVSSVVEPTLVAVTLRAWPCFIDCSKGREETLTTTCEWQVSIPSRMTKMLPFFASSILVRFQAFKHDVAKAFDSLFIPHRGQITKREERIPNFFFFFHSSLSMRISLLILSIIFRYVFGISHTPQSISNPMTSPQSAALCGREGKPRSAICDPDKILGTESGDVIEGLINSIQTAELAVVLVNRMASSYVSSFEGSIEKASEKFARTIHDSWGVGDANRNDGAVIFLSVEDRAVFISTGQGIEKTCFELWLAEMIC